MNIVVSETERNVFIKWTSRSCVTLKVILHAAKGAPSVWTNNQTHLRVTD